MEVCSMDFVLGLLVGGVGGPFLWELLKKGYKKVKEWGAK
jgi:hypothetical protein